MLVQIAVAVSLIVGNPGVCEEIPAWTEQAENPAYVPEVPEEIVLADRPAVIKEHPAVVVEHPATEDEIVVDGYLKWVWNGGRTEIAPEFPGDLWNKTNDNRPNKHDPLGVVYKTGNGKNASWAIYVEQTRVIPGTPAWTETISEAWTEVISEAWTERIVTVPYQPAIGEPYLFIEHPAVTCPAPEEPEEVVPPVEVPETPVEEAVTPEAEAVETPRIEKLAMTGGGETFPLFLGALFAIVLGAVITRRKKDSK